MRHRRQRSTVRSVAICLVLTAVCPIAAYFTYHAVRAGEIRMRDGRQTYVVKKTTAPGEYWLWIAGTTAVTVFAAAKVISEGRKLFGDSEKNA
jgi:hypothetical protein